MNPRKVGYMSFSATSTYAKNYQLFPSLNHNNFYTGIQTHNICRMYVATVLPTVLPTEKSSLFKTDAWFENLIDIYRQSPIFSLVTKKIF